MDGRSAEVPPCDLHILKLLNYRCPPPANTKIPCVQSAAYATTASWGAVTTALLSAVVAMAY